MFLKVVQKYIYTSDRERYPIGFMVDTILRYLRIYQHKPQPTMAAAQLQPQSTDDIFDILLAHQYRLSLTTVPRQSFFRVVAVVFFSRRSLDGIGTRRDNDNNERHHDNNERHHVVGTNDEPHSIAGSICAERAALMQLRFVPDLEQITKIVIVTDAIEAISPGMLCREFMASHDRIPWEMPIVLGRSVCRKCGFTVSGNKCKDSTEFCDSIQKNDIKRDVNCNLFARCKSAMNETDDSDDYPSSSHDFLGVKITLRDLFPYPSVYSRLSSYEAKKFGENFAAGSRSDKSITTSSFETSTDLPIQPRESHHSHSLVDSGVCGTPRDMDHSHRRKWFIRLAMEGSVGESRHAHIHPIQYGAAVLFNDGTIATATQKSALEYGCTLDAVGQLASIIDKKAIQINEDGTPCRPTLLVQCDQFGIAHAPFAPGRSFLMERGYGDCKVLIHQQISKKGEEEGEDQDCKTNINGDVTTENAKSNDINLQLVEVEVNDLAPSPPDIFGNKTISNHLNPNMS